MWCDAPESTIQALGEGFIVEFLMVIQAHVVSFQFSMNLNHKQCNITIVAVNQNHKKNNHA
jgi:hypothetical protein